jgi:hypothetical protein
MKIVVVVNMVSVGVKRLLLERLRSWYFFLNKMYLQYINTLTSVLDSTKIVPGQPISCRTLAVRGGPGTTSSGHGRYSSKKMAQKKKHSSRRVQNQSRICLGRLWRYFLYRCNKSGRV